jgi:predicted AlkP superfamily phosphohydrolase/phosphomutase
MAKTLLLGLDGATFKVLDPLMQSGHMPFIAQLVADGAHAELLSTVHCLTPQAWTSMITGRTPGHHGIFDFVYGHPESNGVSYNLNMSHHICCPTLWSLLSERGLRVANLNFPVSFPPDPKVSNALCVSGFMPERYLRDSVYPPEFYDALRNMPGFDSKLLSINVNEEFESIQYRKPEEYEPWIVYHIKRAEQWCKVVELLMREKSPDLIAIVFDGVDHLQHLCWRLLDPALCPKTPTIWEANICNLCLSYFQQLDGLIRRIVTLAGREANTFLVSDHGFGPTNTVFFANGWLAKQGYLRWAAGYEKTAPTRIASQPIKDHVEGIDWSQTVAYALTPTSNGIYVRRAHGPGLPGIQPSDYLGFRGRLVEELLSLTDPATGKPFFRRVLTREEAFPGENAERAPDLTLIMQDYGFQSVLNSDTIFRNRPEPWGTHYPEGIFIASGLDIAPLGRIPRMEIVDVTSVLLQSLAVEAEESLRETLAKIEVTMEGRCPEGLFDSRKRVQAEVLRLLVKLNYFQPI